ncbi:radical sam protein : Radical SAM family protein OS=Zobellia galactanivorans (strain DSM 12802 / CIP 106680 / NCIMB 13871 / Dsij) GN=zobellia_1667 PE=4 SV=1: Radical_SAM: Fer4_14 [Gemmataceae bacterium]|nr:radical sam protein : Radical SAM family protein OS=Zobellia galactanivorans (strain DSM 12802 / CIP 106680 / NCIMB 13871 / Dsij) GN=zobellia_1667 PE=4 SV=1: Radical_SAM: Fer4_14 [Gemmataceae bacterium]VTT99548.1 radical sam protein : Radical SAM family protein OS=Zobellia galactanivorans (strain DSM 12802 / CIP 106680 / NCIMB 13871 / Dsij) GN=zobellia_1667 PE=4 SV=1: Radical_SAM: Fer4_14 [Gemmataceae bacterium]
MINMVTLPAVSEGLTIPKEFGAGLHLKTTTSLCPTCLARIPADVFERNSEIWMDKACAKHGQFSALLAGDARHYYVADPNTSSLGSCCGAGGHCGDQTANHSCNMLIEITQRCNLSCPTCYAGSSPDRDEFLSLGAFTELLDGLLAKGKGDADLMQLSGGEPTIHPEFFAVLDHALARGVRQVYVNTNGIKLADRRFAEQLAARGERVSVYLQFDGFKRTTLELLRDRGDLLETKLRAADHCEALGINTVPVMTLTPGVNDDELGAFVRFAASRPRSVHKVMIQPAMYSGRYENPRVVRRLTVGDVAKLVAAQTDGLFSEDDFTPIPCSDPNCFSTAVALRGPDWLVPVSRYLPRYATWADAANRGLIAAVADTFDAPGGLAGLIQGVFTSGALESLEEGAVDRLLDLVAALPAGSGGTWDGLFAIGVKPFMDAHTYDQDRIDKCCVHVIARDGTPVSFCEYNAVNRPQGRM